MSRSSAVEPIKAVPVIERPPRRKKDRALLPPELLGSAVKQAFAMLRPDIQWKNPVRLSLRTG